MRPGRSFVAFRVTVSDVWAQGPWNGDEHPACLLVMVALWNGADHYIFALFLLSSICLLFPRLISAVGAWMSTILPHMVWPQCDFRMQV